MRNPIKKEYATAQHMTVLSVLALLSPVVGVLVEMSLAWRFGDSTTVDAFRLVSLVLVFGNQLFFDQILGNVVIPLFNEYRANGDEVSGWRLSFSIALSLSLVALVFTMLAWLKSAAFIGFLGPGLTGRSLIEAETLLRFFCVAFILMVWSGVVSGILQTKRIFWVLPISNLLTNVFLVVSILLIGRGPGVYALGIGNLAGALVMLVLHIVILSRAARASGLKLRNNLRFGPLAGLKKAARLSLPLLGMIFVGQWVMIIINRTLSQLPPGTLANFGYAWKLLMLMAIMPASLSTVIFPDFADSHAENKPEEFMRIVTRGIKMTLLLTLPVAGVLFFAGNPLVILMLKRGAMADAPVAEVSGLFGILVISGAASALWALLQKVAFAKQDTRTPAVAAIINALVVTWLIPRAAPFGGSLGVAWAICIISWIMAIGLFFYLTWKYHMINVRDILTYALSLAVVSLSIAIIAAITRSVFELQNISSAGGLLFEFVCIATISLFFGYRISLLLGIKEAHEVLGYVWWQLKQLVLLKTRQKTTRASVEEV